MKSLLVCRSLAHGNTRKVARAMADVLHADVVDPDDIDPNDVDHYDLVGLGSGIYFWRFHPRLYRFVDRLPDGHGRTAFVFFTSGSREPLFWSYSRALARRLTAKGYRVEGTFSCRGWDTVGPLSLIGGYNRGHSDNASAPPGGSPTFSTRRDSLRRPLIRSAGRPPRVPIKVGAIPTRIRADANGEWVSGACGSKPSR